MGMKIWTDMVDKKFTAYVEADEGDRYKGKLVITLGEEVIHTRSVGISYGAPFGPDVTDVTIWENFCMEAVDQYYLNEQKKANDELVASLDMSSVPTVHVENNNARETPLTKGYAPDMSEWPNAMPYRTSHLPLQAVFSEKGPEEKKKE